MGSDETAPVLTLLLVGLRLDSKGKHRKTHADGHKSLKVVHPAVVRVTRHVLVVEDVTDVLIKEGDFFPEHSLAFMNRHLVEFVRVLQLGMLGLQLAVKLAMLD